MDPVGNDSRFMEVTIQGLPLQYNFHAIDIIAAKIG
jgi:hypothetical protein